MSLERDFYEQFGIYELRNIARDKGVAHPTSLRKRELIKQIVKLDNGEILPHIDKYNRGRPAKFIKLPNINRNCFDCPVYKRIKELYELVLNYINNQNQKKS